MSEPKTKPTGRMVADFLNSIEDKKMRADGRIVSRMTREATGNKGKMWGTSIVGFGKYDYRPASGREGSWPLISFSPRKRNLSLYIMPGFMEFDKLMSRRGRYKTGKSCLHIKSLDDVDPKKLKALIDASVRHMRRKFPAAWSEETLWEKGLD